MEVIKLKINIRVLLCLTEIEVNVMEPKKSNNIFNVRKTGKDFLEQTNEYKKQAIDIQEHNDTIIIK